MGSVSEEFWNFLVAWNQSSAHYLRKYMQNTYISIKKEVKKENKQYFKKCIYLWYKNLQKFSTMDWID